MGPAEQTAAYLIQRSSKNVKKITRGKLEYIYIYMCVCVCVEEVKWKKNMFDGLFIFGHVSTSIFF